jgi:hypothetical protein
MLSSLYIVRIPVALDESEGWGDAEFAAERNQPLGVTERLPASRVIQVSQMHNFKKHWTAWGLIIVLPIAACTWVLFFGLRVPRNRFQSPNLESAEQARQFLAEARLRIQQFRLETTELDHSKLMEISFNIYLRAIAHPELPEVWQTAASVIDKRSGQNANRMTCGTDSFTIVSQGDRDQFEGAPIVSYQNCTISLDGGEFVAAKNRRTPIKNRKDTMLELKNVHVVYRGGPFPQVNIFSCVECTFDVQLQGIPPPRGRSFIRGLLMSDFSNFSIIVSED